MSSAPDKAKEMTDYILKKKPNDPEAKTLNALILVQKKDLDAALKLVSEVVKADPKQTEAISGDVSIFINIKETQNKRLRC